MRPATCTQTQGSACSDWCTKFGTSGGYNNALGTYLVLPQARHHGQPLAWQSRSFLWPLYPAVQAWLHQVLRSDSVSAFQVYSGPSARQEDIRPNPGSKIYTPDEERRTTRVKEALIWCYTVHTRHVPANLHAPRLRGLRIA